MTPLNQQTTKKAMVALICLAWLLAAGFASPIAFLYTFQYIADPAYGIKPYCTTFEPSYILLMKRGNHFIKNVVNFGQKFFTSTYDVYVFLTFMYQYIIPLMYLIFAYSRMSLKLWRNQIPGNEEQNRDETLILNKRRSIKMMASVVIIFGICWLPWQAFSMVRVFWHDFSRYEN